MHPGLKRPGSIVLLGVSLLLASASLTGVLIFLCRQKPVPLSEGVYHLCREVSGFSGETLELKEGQFRHWFYSDVGGGGSKYPTSGTYVIRGNKLILDAPGLRNEQRTIGNLNGVNVLWREDGLNLWEKEKRIQPYAVLIQNPHSIEAGRAPAPPSVELIYTDEMRNLRGKR